MPLYPFTSTALPLPLKDIDTDLIIPAEFLRTTTKEGLGQNLFRRLKDQNKDFPLNQPKYKKAEILIADSNFGCGSSREHAVWALIDAGFKVIIAPSFADIFSGNSAKNGLLLITLPPKTIKGLLKKATQNNYQITVNLKTQKIILPSSKTLSFPFDPFRKECFLKGLDDLDYLRRNLPKINQFQKSKSFPTPKIADSSRLNY